MTTYDLSPKDAAKLLGIHVDTLKRAADKGQIPFWETPGGWRRFNRDDIAAYKAGQVKGQPEAVA